jgi:hypothetical protein
MNAIGLAGKTVTLSGEYQASSTTTILTKLFYSNSVDVAVAGSWTEITATSGGSVSAVTGSFTKSSSVFAVPSTAKSLMVLFDTGSVSTGLSLYYGNIQLEIGTQSSPFTRAGGTIQGELSACQRYLPALSVDGNDVITGQAYSTTQVIVPYVFPVQPRVKPTGITVSSAASFYVRNSTAGFVVCSSVAFQSGGPTSGSLVATVASGLTAGNASAFFGNSPGLILWTGCEL